MTEPFPILNEILIKKCYILLKKIKFLLNEATNVGSIDHTVVFNYYIVSDMDGEKGDSFEISSQKISIKNPGDINFAKKLPRSKLFKRRSYNNSLSYNAMPPCIEIFFEFYQNL
jgi:hypothetical protein